MESIVGISKKGEDERGAMDGRRSRPLGSVGNIHWKEKHVYNLSHWSRRLGAKRTPPEERVSTLLDERQPGHLGTVFTIIIALD